MSDIGRIIRRDLDQLPVLPRERWLPTRRTPRRRAGLGALRLMGTIAVLVVALGLGLTLSRVRAELAAPSQRPASTATAGTGLVVDGITVMPRQTVLARIAVSNLEHPTVTRYAAKLVRKDATIGGDLVAPVGAPRGSSGLWWVVALSGDVRCAYCFVSPSTPQTFHSAVYWVDAAAGDVMGMQAFPAFWPSGFDPLPDAALAENSITAVGLVVEIRGSDTIVVVTSADASPDHPSGSRLVLRADANTAYSWAAGLVGGSALTLDELVRGLQVVPHGTELAAVVFENTPAPDGSYRLESLATGIDTR